MTSNGILPWIADSGVEPLTAEWKTGCWVNNWRTISLKTIQRNTLQPMIADNVTIVIIPMTVTQVFFQKACPANSYEVSNAIHSE